MQDILLELGKSPQARSLLKTIGLPVPIPQDLRRVKGPWQERPLFDQDIVIWQQANSALKEHLAYALTKAGASPWLANSETDLWSTYQANGQAFGRLPQSFTDQDTKKRHHALVFDATTCKTPSDLEAMYAFFHSRVRAIKRSGRVLILGRPPHAEENSTAAATQAGLTGFVRSFAKELGRNGTTAHLISVEEGAEDRLAGVLYFLLSYRSAYVSGQPFLVQTIVKSVEPPPLLFPLEGKVALVTGAARGIGAATARRLAEEGAHVVCLDRPQDDGPTSKLAREIGGSSLLVDITDPEAPAKITESLRGLGGVDIVVHNAGITRDKTLARMSEQQWQLTLDVNLDAVLRINDALEAGPLNDNARIICLSSVTGIAGNMGQTNYSTSKSGIIGFVQHASKSLAKRGVTVNAIAPGFIETRLTAAIPAMVREVARRMNNLSQGGQPRDVAEAITWLALPHTSGMTGQVVRVCGGALIGA